MEFLSKRPAAVSLALCLSVVLLATSARAINEQKEAGHHEHGSHPECPLPKTAMDILKCAGENHPKIRAAVLEADSVQSRESKDAQIANPRLNLEAVSGELKNQTRKETKISLMQPFEIGGGRGARIALAEANTARSQADLQSIRADVLIETVVNLYRLSQLQRQSESSQRTIQAYQSSINSLKRRPALSPEQRVSLSVFQAALAEVKLREFSVTEERRALSHYFHLATGNSYEEIKNVLPTEYKWPILAETSEIKSPSKIKALADVQSAEALLKIEKSHSWPVLEIGPMVQMEEEGSEKANLYGLQLSFPLPLFSLNGGGRNSAHTEIRRTQEIVAITERIDSHEREEILHNYQDSLKILKDSPAFSEIDEENRRNQKLVAGGLIPASLVVEAQRSNLELIKTLQERELKTLQALWTIYKLDGRIFSESL